ncbi:helix-turn-helix domain-containing protein [Mucilaginibacter myungsuensis]|uniref:Helix-turn-helix transcriptional regulator n=1 Tax=Mucilaginibacter myungsuensis TaxID=649104 RepID=A0A929KXG0_9SPHI|nr:AraC family transcriptional regulator [Mucilaginibacter myungsuensis]MBE9662248.1 helix-turn-helix transcriptional regulator [Mucilaginibacter myungsuensis]MDN3599316.1 AraC family transcriptional regulator [Mucilaginibacter myungsuensis]
MQTTETLEDFYAHKFGTTPPPTANGVGAFNVFRLEDCWNGGKVVTPYSRRDFYKITLIRGKHRYHYADKSIEVDGTTLIFFNPQVPYRFEPLDETTTGFFCIFKDSFFTESMRGNIHDLPMFMLGGKPAYTLNETQETQAITLFQKMFDEIESDYRFKYDLLRNYVTEMIHFAMKMQPTETLYQHPDANSRITAVFTELLERQFPIENPGQRFTLRSASDFAEQLSVHVNHLNRAVRSTTGKTTTAHIAERITAEATALLKHTSWNVAEISYSLGFEEPAHFNNFFKKHTNFTPTAIRVV